MLRWDGNEATMMETYRNIMQKALENNGNLEDPERDGKITLNWTSGKLVVKMRDE
jgi:hypothetical protein